MVRRVSLLGVTFGRKGDRSIVRAAVPSGYHEIFSNSTDVSTQYPADRFRILPNSKLYAVLMG